MSCIYIVIGFMYFFYCNIIYENFSRTILSFIFFDIKCFMLNRFFNCDVEVN